MKEISWIRLENFRTHKDTTTHFKAGLNILTGESNSGKTNILRALRWVSHNKPLGSGMISRSLKASFTRVTIGMADGVVVIRERNKSGSMNKYRLQSHGQMDQIFEGFGQDVPLEIQQVMGIKEVDFGTKKKFSLNFALQLDGPFLLTETDTDAAKILGKLSGTEEVDAASKQLALDIYRNTQKEKLLNVEIKRLDGEISKYDGLPAMKKRIDKLGNTLEKVRENRKRLEVLVPLEKSLEIAERNIAMAKGFLDGWSEMESLEIILNAVESKEIKRAKAVELSSRLKEVDSLFWQAMEVTTSWGNVNHCSIVHNATHEKSLLCLQLKRLQQKINVLDSQSKVCKETLLNREPVINTEELCKSVKDATNKKTKLVQLKTLFAQIEVARHRALAEIGKDASNVAAENLMAGVVYDKSKYLALVGLKNGFKLNNSSISGNKAKVEELAKNLALDENEYLRKLNSLGICPLCGGEINANKLKEVI